MVYVQDGFNCCGIAEIDGIIGETPQDVVRHVCYTLLELGGESDCPVAVRRTPILIFSDITNFKDGNTLMTFIRKHKLGVVATSRSRINPGSSNRLKVYVWTVNDRNLIAYAKKNKLVD